MRYVKAKIGKPICLGKAQENNSTTVLFDISQWRKDYTGGYITLIHQRPTDAGGSPVGGLTLNGDSAEWLVSSGDLQFAGSGLAELVLTVNGVIEKTVTYITQISESVSESGSTPPPPVEGYIQELIDAGNAVQAAVDSYDEMTAEATEGQTASAEIDHSGDHPVLKLVIPSGGGGGDVQSVNGKTGVVVLNANDVGALPSSTPIPPAVTVDSSLSDNSTNPVQNKIIKAALDSQSETIVDLNRALKDKADIIVSSASGAIASFPDGAESTAKKLVVGIEPVQTGSGDPSPTNVRPITGWTGANVTRTGVNIVECTVQTRSGVTGSKNADGTFHIEGTATEASYPVNLKAMTLKAGTYVFSISALPSGVVASFGLNRAWAGSITQGKTITVADGTVLTGYVEVVTGTTVNADIAIQLEVGSVASGTIEPYTGNQISVNWQSEAGTVYGGSLTVNEDGTGKLVVDRAIVDMGNLVWTYNTTYAFFTSSSVSTRKAGVLNVLSDLFKTMAGSWTGTPEQNAIWGDGSNATVYVQIPPLDNVDDFMSLVDGHQLMYELDTPIEYPMTDLEVIELFKGTNNVWADTGDTSVTYRADTKLYIDNKLAELVAQIVNS